MSFTVTFFAGGGTVAGGVSEEEEVGGELAGSSLREFLRGIRVPGFEEEGRGDSLVG
eukprot:CAMPEP_0182494364 /NCGR_PEP_ID=MMETSP1321-20130603/3234_1 /TAXON_ID=91990 /ORGANISM="Bolidomonas sp., Strain RCC1657" /LENGTH=56 /DNA_ID=CAMNT_0024697415 /DNA_START=307 /DNA_END=477 /DNA_ORIENTATION=+